MLNTRHYILTLLTILIACIAEINAAPKKYYHRKGTKHSYTTQKKTYNIQDSLLNVPREKPQITYHEKDVPLEYIIKLDSTLHDYQANYAIHTARCDFDSVLSEPLEDSVYIKRLQSIPSVIELTYNSVVRDFISLYTIRRSKLTSLVLGQSDYYFPIFEDALDAEGVPFELKYLPIIESALNPRAYSPAGASGLWQFISSTGRTYGLRINSLIDERRDPIKSSQAAAKYLKHLYSIYEDWTLVIAAYNCGPGNVNKAIRRAGGEKDYWAIYPYLPKETRGYVPAFIAATYAMNYHQEHNICPKIVERCHYIDTVHVSEKIHLVQIADVLDIDINDLRILNPQFKTDIVPGNVTECNLILPTDKISQFEMYKNTILAYNVPGYVPHRPQVEPQKHVTSYNNKNVKQGNKQNNIAKNKGIAENGDSTKTDTAEKKQEIAIATPAKSNQKKPSSQKSATKNDISKVTKYIVKQGDTLYGIATRNKVSVVNLKEWNSLDSDKLRIGQVIIVKNTK